MSGGFIPNYLGAGGASSRGSDIGDFLESPDVGALITKTSGQQWLRTGSVVASASYAQAAALDFLKCTGLAATQATSVGTINTDIATNGAGVWVMAYSNSTNLLFSTDNCATLETVAHSAGQTITSVCWDSTNNLFVCAGNTATQFFTSTQTAASVGTAWTARTGSAITSAIADTTIVRASSAEVVMVCSNATTGGASRSTNGTTWTAANFAAAPFSGAINASMSLVSLGSGIWVAQGTQSASQQRTTDGGANWSTIASGASFSTVSQGAFGNGICVLPEPATGNIYTSATGATGTWVNRGNPFGLWRIMQVMFDGTRFVASLQAQGSSSSHHRSAYAYSNDGSIWYLRGFLNKSWADTVQYRVHSDGTNLVFAPIFTASSGAVYGTFAANSFIGIPYPCSSSSPAVNQQQTTLQYVRIK